MHLGDKISGMSACSESEGPGHQGHSDDPKRAIDEVGDLPNLAI